MNPLLLPPNNLFAGCGTAEIAFCVTCAAATLKVCTPNSSTFPIRFNLNLKKFELCSPCKKVLCRDGHGAKLFLCRGHRGKKVACATSTAEFFSPRHSTGAMAHRCRLSFRPTFAPGRKSVTCDHFTWGGAPSSSSFRRGQAPTSALRLDNPWLGWGSQGVAEGGIKFWYQPGSQKGGGVSGGGSLRCGQLREAGPGRGRGGRGGRQRLPRAPADLRGVPDGAGPCRCGPAVGFLGWHAPLCTVSRGR